MVHELDTANNYFCIYEKIKFACFFLAHPVSSYMSISQSDLSVSLTENIDLGSRYLMTPSLSVRTPIGTKVTFRWDFESLSICNYLPMKGESPPEGFSVR